MHDSVMRWTRQVVDELGLAGLDTIEIGAQIVNGTVRSLFSGRYLGVDMAPGRGVDVVADAQDLSAWDDCTWPVVISTEMLEHCPRPWRAVAEMARICEPGGIVIVTARGYDERGCWEVHAYPWDFYRYSAESMRLLAEDAGLEVVKCDRDPEGPGWLLLAVKP